MNAVMIGKVTEAITKAADDWDSVGFFLPPSLLNDLSEAAVAAIREPAESMVLAGAKKVRGGTPYDCAAATWRAMIDEMLK